MNLYNAIHLIHFIQRIFLVNLVIIGIAGQADICLE